MLGFHSMENISQNVIPAFVLTLLAGLATGVGSAIALLARKTNHRFLAAALGFSAGVMIYVSFMELLPNALHTLTGEWGETAGNWGTTGFFFLGIFIIALIDKLVPEAENPHEMHDLSELATTPPVAHEQVLFRTGIFTALAIGIHNFPEGIATFASALADPKLGASIAVAIAIHNIPEGIAVSVPLYYATGNRKKAFIYSFLSGLAEPLGALLSFVFLYRFMSPVLLSALFAGVAGIMVYISLDELLPAAEKYGEHHASILGVMAGMLLMAVSLLLFL